MTDEIIIHCDGGALGNPGPAASAFVVIKNQQIIYQENQKIGITTNNVAEYQAVIMALNWLHQQPNFSNEQINFFLDSQLVVNQINGLYRVKNFKLIPLITKVKSLEKTLNCHLTFRHIPREKNTVADTLVKKTFI